MAGDAFVFQFEAHQLALDAGFFLAGHFFASGKARLQFGDPAQARLKGRGAFAQVVAVEAQAGFEAEGIAGSETTGLDAVGLAALHEGVPHAGSLLVGQVQLKAAGAGVARIGDDDVGVARYLAFAEMVKGDLIEGRFGERLEQGFGLRALDRQQRHVVRLVVELDVVAFGKAVEALPVFFEVGRIDHRHEFLLAQAIDQQVVHQAAAVVGQGAVLHTAREELIDIVGSGVLEELPRLRAPHEEFAHMGDIEEAHRLAHGEVFFGDRSVAHRHLEAGEVHHFSAQGGVLVVQRGRFHTLVAMCVWRIDQ